MGDLVTCQNNSSVTSPADVALGSERAPLGPVGLAVGRLRSSLGGVLCFSSCVDVCARCIARAAATALRIFLTGGSTWIGKRGCRQGFHITHPTFFLRDLPPSGAALQLSSRASSGFCVVISVVEAFRMSID